MAKRKTLFEEYAFEIGVVTLPAYLVLLVFGIVYMTTRLGIALIIVSLVGALASIASLRMGRKDIKW